MGRMLQKKKNRSSVPRATQKAKSKRKSIKASPLVAAHWDKHLTLSQNYRRLGLANKLNAKTGGTEINVTDIQGGERGQQKKEDPLTIAASKPAAKTGLKTTKVVRDEHGKILKVIHEKKPFNPLNDPLNAMDDDDDFEGPSDDFHSVTHERAKHAGIVPKLEAAASAELADIAKRKKPRKQSQREQEWIEQLVGLYGKDVRAMSVDRKLNPNQQTEADIRRRVDLWQKSK